MANILVIGRDPEQVDLYEYTAVNVRYGRKSTLRLIRIDPKDQNEHLRLCREYEPVAVLAHGHVEMRLIAKAVAEGYLHVGFLPDHNGEGSNLGMALFSLHPGKDPQPIPVRTA